MLDKKVHIPLFDTLERIRKSFNPLERWLFYFLSALLTTGSALILYQAYTNITISVPGYGGKIVEGVVGTPRFINPILAISQTDKDLSELVYAGLMSRNQNGELIPEMAETYTVSDDAKTYTFTLRENLTFHDGTPLTADDVVFTIQKAVQPEIKSPERANWEGVSVEKVDDITVKFILRQPYAQFLQNTTLGILPEEHWGKFTADEFIFSKLNTEPIGSGPYTFHNSEYDASGIPENMILKAFDKYALGMPYIKDVVFKFYPNRNELKNALIKKEITNAGNISPEFVSEIISKNTNLNIMTSTLPRIFAIFLNQKNNTALQNKNIKEALRDSIDKDELIKQILGGYAQNISSTFISNNQKETSSADKKSMADIRNKIEKGGWTMQDDKMFYKKDNPLSITLKTANTDELKNVANYISNMWKNSGIHVKLEIFEPGNLAQQVLRPRDYEALLFGIIIGTEQDPYAFWHSSQKSDPGLNITNYSNAKVDSLIEKSRRATNNETRRKLYEQISEEINKDIPAIFLYAPTYLYAISKKVKGVKFPTSMEPHERFSNIHSWYINENKIFNFN